MKGEEIKEVRSLSLEIKKLGNAIWATAEPNSYYYPSFHIWPQGYAFSE